MRECGSSVSTSWDSASWLVACYDFVLGFLLWSFLLRLFRQCLMAGFLRRLIGVDRWSLYRTGWRWRFFFLIGGLKVKFFVFLLEINGLIGVIVELLLGHFVILHFLVLINMQFKGRKYHL